MVFEETNTYSTSIVGESKALTVGESIDSPPHAPWVCVLSTLALSLSSCLKTLIFEYSQILFLKIEHIKMSNKLRYFKFLLLAKLMGEINLSFMF